MTHEYIGYEERAVGWTDEELKRVISAIDELEREGPTSTRKTVTSMLMGVTTNQTVPSNDEKEYLVSKPTLITRMVSLVMRPPNLNQLVGATLPLREQNLPPNPSSRLMKQVHLGASDENITSHGSEIKDQRGELADVSRCEVNDFMSRCTGKDGGRLTLLPRVLCHCGVLTL